MKGLRTLIRLHRAKVDEMRVALSVLERRRDAIDSEIERMGAELNAERRFATTSIGAGIAFGPFAEVVRERQQAMAIAGASVDDEMVEAREHIAAAFRELKRYEITAEHRAAALKREQVRREQKFQDEVGSTIFRRRRSP